MSEDATTLPRPPALPGMVREEPLTPAPRKSSLEELRAGEDPYVAAIDELRVEVLRLSARLPELDARTSKTDLEQEAKIAAQKIALDDHEKRMQRIEEDAKVAASGTSALVNALTGKLFVRGPDGKLEVSTAKLLGAFVALGTLVQVLLQAYRQLHGGGK